MVLILWSLILKFNLSIEIGFSIKYEELRILLSFDFNLKPRILAFTRNNIYLFIIWQIITK